MSGELKNKKGQVFWSDECLDAVKAINFAVDKIDDHYDRLDFLIGWSEGDVADWPEFLTYIATKENDA